MYSRFRPLIPVLLLLVCYLSTVIVWLKGTTTDKGAPAYYVLSAKHYGAFAATGATLASYFLLRRFYKYFFALTLLLGILGLINFTISELKVWFVMGPLQIGMSPILAFVGVVAYLLYPQRFNSKLFALIKPSEEKAARARQEEIISFKEKFARKTTEELAQIVAANALVPPAVVAARQLLQERQ